MIHLECHCPSILYFQSTLDLRALSGGALDGVPGQIMLSVSTLVILRRTFVVIEYFHFRKFGVKVESVRIIF